jgi:hypothetical protein
MKADDGEIRLILEGGRFKVVGPRVSVTPKGWFMRRSIYEQTRRDSRQDRKTRRRH